LFRKFFGLAISGAGAPDFSYYVLGETEFQEFDLLTAVHSKVFTTRRTMTLVALQLWNTTDSVFVAKIF
jgi:hypothetical protein